MARIRDDLKGSIIVGGHILRAGDQVPAGVKVHLSRLAHAQEAILGHAPLEGPGRPVKPHHASGVDKWHTYAAAIGLHVPEGADKAAIRALVAEAEDAGG